MHERTKFVERLQVSSLATDDDYGEIVDEPEIMPDYSLGRFCCVCVCVHMQTVSRTVSLLISDRQVHCCTVCTKLVYLMLYRFGVDVLSRLKFTLYCMITVKPVNTVSSSSFCFK